jgi:hypothetical protein
MSNNKQHTVIFKDLRNSDLHVDAIYNGGVTGNMADEPLSKLVPGLENAGGIRRIVRGEKKNKEVK